MPPSGKVYVSHDREDSKRYASLLALLSSWGIDYWFDAQEPHAGQQLSQQAQMVLSESTVFLRLCTEATRRSYWMSLETGAFLSLQAEDYRQGHAGQRKLVNLIVENSYVPEPFDRATIVVDAVSKPKLVWTNELRGALGLPPLPEGTPIAVDLTPTQAPVTRRRALALGAAGVVLLAAVGTTGALLVRSGGHLPLIGGTGGTPTPKATATPRPPTTDKHLKWFFKTGAKITSSPALADNTLYVCSGDGSLYALDARNSALSWSFDLGAPALHTPVVTPDALYFNVNSSCVKFNVGTRSIVWDFFGIVADPVIADGLVYTSDIGSAEAFDSSTKKFLWAGLAKGVVTGVAVVGTTVYAGSQDTNVYAFDASNAKTPLDLAGDYNQGRMLWAYKTGDQVQVPPGVVDGVVYVGSDDHNLYALDAATGALKWKLPTGNDVRSTPLVANGLVYFGSADGVIYAVDQQGGTTRWTYKTGAAINRSSPTLANGLVYVSSEDAYVYGLDPQSGSLVQKFQTGGVIHSTPLVANGLLYVGSFDGYVYAFDVTR